MTSMIAVGDTLQIDLFELWKIFTIICPDQSKPCGNVMRLLEMVMGREREMEI